MRPRRIFLACSAAAVLAVVIAAHEVMLPFVLAVVIAYMLTPAVARVERRKVPRAVAILLVYALVLGSMAGFARGIAPRIALEFRSLRGELPVLAQEAKENWVPAITDRMRALGIAPPAPPPAPAEPPAVEPSAPHETKEDPLDPNRLVASAIGKSFAYAQANSLEVARAVRDLVAGVARFVFLFFITLMMAAYIMLTRERIVGFFRSLVGERGRGSFDALLVRVDQGLAGVVRGQLVICGINGALSAVGFALVGLKYWPVLALVAAVFSLIPIFGSIVSAVPAVAIGLTQGLGTAAFVLAWIAGIHQLEANVLNPKIMGDAAKIHPVLVIFALLAGEHFFHAVGALLAVPAMSIAQSVFLHLRDAGERDTGASTPPSISSI